MVDQPMKPNPAPDRRLRLALAVSVALNLAVAGVVGGVMLRPDGPHGRSDPRDPGFGFFSEALTPENRKELRKRLKPAAPMVAHDRQSTALNLAAILAALRADPFDPAALDVAMQAQVARMRSRLDLGQELLADFLSDLSASDRQAFADRLEASAGRKPPKHGSETRN